MRVNQAATFLLGLLVASGLGQCLRGEGGDAPSHERPYFMPRWKKRELRGLIKERDWAKASYESIKTQAAQGDGYWAAFLYALDGEDQHLEAARKWLLGWAKSGHVAQYRKRLTTPDYFWTSGKAIAVFQLMTQTYGHEHADKFGIMMHGAGRLLYPDYNAIQYENPAHGWTRNTVCHNTMLVDERDTQAAEPSIRHEFSPEVKFLATSASGVFERVEQTRALFLTTEYLLDVFHASSDVPHTYDYVLHSFGEPRPPIPSAFGASKSLGTRYWAMEGTRGTTTSDPWKLDFVIEEEPASRKGKYGKEWYEHRAAVRLAMAAGRSTQVAFGRWGDKLAELVEGRHKGARMDRLGMLVARRKNVRSTAFIVTHEPYANDEKPRVRVVSKLAESEDAVLVCVQGEDFTDYVAVAFGPQEGLPEHRLSATLVSVAVGRGDASFAFRSYGYLRVPDDGTVTRRGGWIGYRFPSPIKIPSFGKPPETVSLVRKTDIECPLPVRVSLETVRLGTRGERPVTIAIENVLKEEVSGRIELKLPKGLVAEPATPEFGPIPPGKTAEVKMALAASEDARPGEQTLPFRLRYSTAGKREVRTLHLPMKSTVGPSLRYVYPTEGRPYYHIDAPLYTVRLDMFHGMPRYLADDDGTVRLDGSPLFTFSEGEKPMLFEHSGHAYTWAQRAPAALEAHVFDRCRYQVRFRDDRIVVSMDKIWTRPERVSFTVPGDWQSPNGPPQWKRVIAVDGAGRETEARPDTKLKVAAAELQFPDGKWSLAFAFEPPQNITFKGAGLEFSIGSLTDDRWSVGFCQPGELDAWRRRTAE